jgi:uncharacterized alpha-E superfamily protein
LAYGLHPFVDSIQCDINRIGDTISESYFR